MMVRRVSDTAILHFTLYILHSLLRFPDYDPAPRLCHPAPPPRGMGILYQKIARANGEDVNLI